MYSICCDICSMFCIVLYVLYEYKKNLNATFPTNFHCKDKIDYIYTVQNQNEATTKTRV